MTSNTKHSNICKRRLVRGILIVFILCIIIFQPNEGSCIDPLYPKIGKEIPDFKLDPISNYENTRVAKSDLKGKYYILDFWTSSCGACISSFPKLNDIQKKYKDQLKIFLVGLPDKKIHKLYETLREKLNLNLSVAYETRLFNEFVPSGVPHLIWVDKEGIIQAITVSHDLNEKNINEFLSGNHFKFDDFSYEGLKNRKKVYDPSLPFLVNGNGGSEGNYTYRSILTTWQKGMPMKSSPIEDIRDGHYNPGGYSALRVSLVSLYNLAFYGRIAPHSDSIFYYPILQVKDSLEFKGDKGDGSGLYCYSLSVPPEKYNKEDLKRGLKNDLEFYFGYNARIEKRMMPCYVIKIVDRSKLTELQKRINEESVGKYYDIAYNNISMLQLARGIAGRLLNHARVYDESGIDYKISLKINGLNSDPEIVRQALKKYGLDMLPSERLMDVLVISE